MIEQEQKEMCFSNKHPFKLTPPDNDKIRYLHFPCLFQYWKIMGFFWQGPQNLGSFIGSINAKEIYFLITL